MDAAFAQLVPPLTEAEAVAEADRCLECGGPYAEAPCVLGCPAGIDVPAFVAAIACAVPGQAARTIFEENLLGGTCARVCPVEVLCQQACVLLHEGRRPVQIGRLQRFATDYGFEHGLQLRARAEPSGYGVAVVGAGPAGLTCAGELAARGHAVVVFDERDEIGGLARYSIAPYRLLREPLPLEHAALAELGIEFRLGFAIDRPELLRELEALFDAVVLAVGMGVDADVHYPGEHLPGVWESLPFIETLKQGCPAGVGRSVAVIGGGNTAIDVAREAVRLGADDVVVVYRRTDLEMPAYPHEVEEARAEGVRFLFLTNPVRFRGDRALRAVECVRMRLGAPDETGRARPEPVAGSEFVLEVDTAVKALGQRTRNEFLAWIDGLETEHGRIAADPQTGQTGNRKYFAAGDATNGGATVVEAVREAKTAALGVDEFLRESGP